MKKSRLAFIACYVAAIIGIICMFAAIFLDGDSILRIVLTLAFIIGESCLILSTKCPVCGRLGVHPRLPDEDAGYCCRCGKHIEWK